MRHKVETRNALGIPFIQSVSLQWFRASDEEPCQSSVGTTTAADTSYSTIEKTEV